MGWYATLKVDGDFKKEFYDREDVRDAFVNDKDFVMDMFYDAHEMYNAYRSLEQRCKRRKEILHDFTMEIVERYPELFEEEDDEDE